LKLWGYPAWLSWLFAHIYFLIGSRNRIVVVNSAHQTEAVIVAPTWIDTTVFDRASPRCGEKLRLGRDAILSREVDRNRRRHFAGLDVNDMNVHGSLRLA
jgi:hypothetical protein